jgi:hypothetical protein
MERRVKQAARDPSETRAFHDNLSGRPKEGGNEKEVTENP